MQPDAASAAGADSASCSVMQPNAVMQPVLVMLLLMQPDTAC